MNLFRIRGIQLAVHYSFFLLLAYFANEGWNDYGATGMWWSIAMLVAFFTCVVIHELGHSFTAMAFGINVRRILLMPIGGMAELDEIPRQPWREVLITLAGPAMNFVIAGALWKFVPTHNYIAQYSLDGLLWQLFWANIVMGTFNFLPAFPMDGGRILRALLAFKLPYLRATFWAATVGKVVAVLGAIGALLAPQLGLSGQPMYMLAILFAFIFFAGEAEYRGVKRREEIEAHWRVVMARGYQPPPNPPPAPPAEEPPLLHR